MRLLPFWRSSRPISRGIGWLHEAQMHEALQMDTQFAAWMAAVQALHTGGGGAGGREHSRPVGRGVGPLCHRRVGAKVPPRKVASHLAFLARLAVIYADSG